MVTAQHPGPCTNMALAHEPSDGLVEASNYLNHPRSCHGAVEGTSPGMMACTICLPLSSQPGLPTCPA